MAGADALVVAGLDLRQHHVSARGLEQDHRPAARFGAGDHMVVRHHEIPAADHETGARPGVALLREADHAHGRGVHLIGERVCRRDRREQQTGRGQGGQWYIGLWSCRSGVIKLPKRPTNDIQTSTSVSRFPYLICRKAINSY